MQIQLTGRHVDITDPIREFIDTKFARLANHCDDITSAHVILSVEKGRHRAEAKLHIPGNDIFADSIEKDMYAALDLLLDKLDRQLIKHKEKAKNHHSSKPTLAEADDE